MAMPPLLSLSLRYLWRHRRMGAVVFLVMLLTTSLLSVVPGYATAVAMRSLRSRLGTASATARNLTILASRSYRPNPALLGDLLAPVEDLVAGRLDVRKARLACDLPYRLPGGIEVTEIQLHALSRLPERITVIDGDLPEHWIPRTATEQLQPPRAEVVVGEDIAARLGLQVGDIITTVAGNRLTLVGLVRPTDPADELWLDDLSAFALHVRAQDTNTDVARLPLITSEQSLKSYFPLHTAESRVVLHHDRITVHNTAEITDILTEMQRLAANEGLQLSSGLPGLLADFRADEATARITLFLLTAQTMAFALYTLVMLVQFLQTRSAVELATMGDRGAARGQITAIFGLTFLGTMLPAALLGPPLSHAVLHLVLDDAGVLLTRLPPAGAWWIALGVGGLTWFVLTLAIAIGARRNLIETTRMRARPPARAAWQRLGVDLFLFILGALAYWQLRESGSSVLPMLSRTGGAGSTDVIDPVLLLGPSLLLIAVAMLFLRLFPPLLRGLGRLSGGARGLLLPLGIERIGRAPQMPSRVILLISLATGLALFARTFGASLTARQAEMARYLAGADLRLSLENATDTSRLAAELAQTPGITATPVIRAALHSYSQGSLPLLIVDRHSFAAVAAYPEAISSLTVPRLMAALAPLPPAQGAAADGSGQAVPAIFAHTALPTTNMAGEEIILSLNGADLVLRVQGIVANFPTLSGAYIIVDRAALSAAIGDQAVQQLGQTELWVSMAGAATPAAVLNRPGVSVIAEATAEQASLQADALTRSALGAFTLNAGALMLLSWIAFLLVHYFSAEQRGYEISILRAGGLSTRQLLALLAIEGLLVMALGVVSGTAIGLGLAKAMVPALSSVVSGALAGAPITRIIMDWRSTVLLGGVLAAGYGAAMVTVIGILWRAGVHRALRLGEG